LQKNGSIRSVGIRLDASHADSQSCVLS